MLSGRPVPMGGRGIDYDQRSKDPSLDRKKQQIQDNFTREEPNYSAGNLARSFLCCTAVHLQLFLLEVGRVFLPPRAPLDPDITFHTKSALSGSSSRQDWTLHLPGPDACLGLGTEQGLNPHLHSQHPVSSPQPPSEPTCALCPPELCFLLRPTARSLDRGRRPALPSF